MEPTCAVEAQPLPVILVVERVRILAGCCPMCAPDEFLTTCLSRCEGALLRSSRVRNAHGLETMVRFHSFAISSASAVAFHTIPRSDSAFMRPLYTPMNLSTGPLNIAEPPSCIATAPPARYARTGEPD